MKNVIALLAFVFFAGLMSAQAQSTQTPGVNERQHNQHDRIEQGVASGELTRVEAADARHKQRHIRRAERRAKADGDVTKKERARLNHKQNRASRALYHDKHDAQDRPRAN